MFNSRETTGQHFAVCPHDCPDACGWLVKTDSGSVVDIRGNPHHPFTQGIMCGKTRDYIQKRVYHPERLLYPAKRVGKKGEGLFVRISWEEAVYSICRNLESVLITPRGGDKVLPYCSSGTMGLIQGLSMGSRFFNRVNSCSVKDTVCCGAGEEGLRHTIGANVGPDPEQVVNARLIIIWGTNTIVTNQHFWYFVKKACSKGAYLVVIDPIKTETAEYADLFLQIRPGTDSILALGIINYLINTSSIDTAYVSNNTKGFEILRSRAAEYTLDKVIEETQLKKNEVTKLFDMYSRLRPAFIRSGWGIQRHGGGGMTVRTISCLPALTGDWRYPAGGFLISTSGSFPVNYSALKRPDLRTAPPRVFNMCRLGETLLEADPPIKFLYIYDANPAASVPGQNRILQGLEREDLFTVVHEQFLTDTADYADILLPATTQLEHQDLHISYGHLYMGWNERAIEPRGETKCNNDVFRLMAQNMGFLEECFYENDEEIALQAMTISDPKMECISIERLKKEGFAKLNIDEDFAPFRNGGFFTPSGKCEFYSENLGKEGFDPLPGYIKPFELNSKTKGPYELILLSPADKKLVNSTFGNMKDYKKANYPAKVNMSRVDAVKRGIKNGQKVVVYNDRGSFAAVAVITDKVKPGICYTNSVLWLKYNKGSNVNATVPERDADLGGGPTFYDNKVEIFPKED